MWEALIGVLGALAGTVLGYLLSKRVSMEQWKREVEAATEKRLMDLTEQLLLLSAELIAAPGGDLGLSGENQARLLGTTRLLRSHAQRRHQKYGEMVGLLAARVAKARSRVEASAGLVSLMTLSNVWLMDPVSVRALRMDDVLVTPDELT